ncbi:S8 family serine peptidase [Lentzea sp. NPDC051213]|uniref:S8 family peptidase n=1 Tax=Lentzea sp. NPDC051213 TaxID=3364126 RepID=UPI003788895D
MTTAAVVMPAGSAQGSVGTILGADRPGRVEGSYIVVLKEQSKSAAALPDLVDRYGGEVRTVWQHAMNGYLVRMPAAKAARLAADPRVAYVEQDGEVRAQDVQPNPPSWGLDRIDQRNLPLNSSYTYNTTASNVTAYVIDTGVSLTHSTFGGRVTWAINTTFDNNNSDCNGHGTHVAGILAGAEHGVAKAANIVAVKVLNCWATGLVSGIITGVDWVTANAVKPAVANMSLGAYGGSDMSLDQAVRNSIASGITYVVASGNANSNACSTTPARVPEAITVNASTTTDRRAEFSNYGNCTDIWAPGENIFSAWHQNDSYFITKSGTSAAAPHVAGAAALWLASHPTDSPAAVANALLTRATTNKITDVVGSPNRLLYVGGMT